MRARLAALASATLALTLLAGCSDNEQLTKAEYIAKGDAICRRTNERSRAAAERLFGNSEPDVERVTKELPVLVRELRALVARFRDLEEPADAGAVVGQALDAISRAADHLDDAVTAAREGDDEAFERGLEAAGPLFEESDEIARDYGFKVCGSEEE